jgi:hypothetical protein
MKKLLLFLISLTLIIAPACTKQPKGRSAYVAGSVFTSLGVASAFSVAPFLFTIWPLIYIPAGLFTIGLPLLEIGIADMAHDAAATREKNINLSDSH